MSDECKKIKNHANRVSSTKVIIFFGVHEHDGSTLKNTKIFLSMLKCNDSK